ncbi:MAG: class I SAM-dependent methyltransferase [Sedimentitalea sp.]
MSKPDALSMHYGQGGLQGRISAALSSAGLHAPYDPDDLAGVDEFHIGGRPATMALIAQLNLTASSRCLDVGCGLGGPARATAKSTGAHVTGIDLTQEFVTTGRALSGMCVMLDLVNLVQGNALDLPFGAAGFDAAYMMHVGMNIADKPALMQQVARVLKPGARFGVYDAMQVGPGAPQYPMPWASAPDHSWLGTPQDYAQALEQAGFDIVEQTDCSALAQKTFAAQAASRETGPPPLGLHLVMGPDTKHKFANLRGAIDSGLLAPVQIVAQRR